CPACEDRAVVKTWDLLLRIAVGDDGNAGAALRDQCVELCPPPLRPPERIARREKARDWRLRIAQPVGDAVEPAVEWRTNDRPAPDPPALLARPEAEVAGLGAAGLPDMREQVRRQGRFSRPVAADHGDQGSKLLPHALSSVP